MSGERRVRGSNGCAERDGALDALRGIAVLGMILVNLQGSGEAAFGAFVHAEWNGFTFADLVFPLFLLASGLALPLAFDRRDSPAGMGRILRRSILLYLIGLALGALIGGIVFARLDLASIRFTGVLERIAIVYLACALTCRVTRSWIGPAILAVMLLALHGLLLHLPAPGEVAASMAPGQGLSGWLDRALLPGRLFRETWDPEGPLSTLSAIATALIGVAVQRRTMRLDRSVVTTLAAAVLCLILARGALLFWPLNKALWTPSFALLTAGIGLAMLAALRAIWPKLEVQRWAQLTATLGRDALTLYVVHALLTALLVLRVGDERIWALAFNALSTLGLPPGWSSLLYALLGGALSIAITLLLLRRGWRLRV
nr:acyltransferase family protein [Sphingomonas colocasiae]